MDGEDLRLVPPVAVELHVAGVVRGDDVRSRPADEAVEVPVVDRRDARVKAVVEMEAGVQDGGVRGAYGEGSCRDKPSGRVVCVGGDERRAAEAGA